MREPSIYCLSNHTNAKHFLWVLSTRLSSCWPPLRVACLVPKGSMREVSFPWTLQRIFSSKDGTESHQTLDHQSDALLKELLLPRIFKSNLSLKSLYCVEACNDIAGAISTSLSRQHSSFRRNVAAVASL